jgi:hypothetical protein
VYNGLAHLAECSGSTHGLATFDGFRMSWKRGPAYSPGHDV